MLLDLASEFVTSAAPVVGAFQCGNPLLNEINDMVARSVRSNLQSVLTDCPHREKLGWLEVSHLMGPSILYYYDARGLYRKICRDTTESQLENGWCRTSPRNTPDSLRVSLSPPNGQRGCACLGCCTAGTVTRTSSRDNMTPWPAIRTTSPPRGTRRDLPRPVWATGMTGRRKRAMQVTPS